MTLTFDSNRYSELLVRYQPKPISTENENDEAIELAQELEHKTNRSPEEQVLLELLVTLIEKFEEEHYSIEAAAPSQILRHILEASDTNATDLIGILGSNAHDISEVLDGKRPISKAQAEVLADRFKVSSSLFISIEH